MIDVEPLIARELERLVPEPAEHRADWNDVVGRAGLLRSRRRRFVLAFAGLAAVLVSAAAVAKTLGGFDSWLSGTPGKPAPEAAQKRFEAANGRSWASFPTTTKLRELIRTQNGGREYVLYGFRSGDSLCLQLAASGFARQPRQCAPASAIANISVPVVVLTSQWDFSDRAQRPVAQVSFGIVADGVTQIGVHAVDGFHRARLGGNAYLFVESRPNTGNRVFAVSAVDATRRRTVVPIESSFWPRSSGRKPGGPTRVETRIAHPRVGWVERGEKRGFPALGGVRFVKPDPLSDLALAFSGGCLIALNSSGAAAATSCGGLFARGPINALIGCDLCGEFMEVRGVAADGVARVTIFLADGSRQTAPLRDNLFTSRVGRAQFPIRIVGYDARNRVVATQLWGAWPRPEAPPAAKRLRPVLRLSGPNGTIAQLHVGPTVRRFDCWRATFSTGQSRGACVAQFFRGPQTNVDLVQPAGPDLFFVGQAGRRARRIEIRFANGDVVFVRPVAGHFVVAVPRAHLSTRQQRAFLVAFDRDGNRTLRQRVFFRLP